MTNLRTKDLHVDVHYLTRVEGHGNIVVNMRDGVIEQCDLEIIESPRYLEALLRDQAYSQAPRLASRICGICSIAHSITSLQAVEKALGIEVSEQTKLLRKLSFFGEILDSHMLHIYFLAAPDFVGAGSVIPLVEISPQIVKRALALKEFAGDLCAILCGRHTHPIAMTVGGFTHFPTRNELERLLMRMEKLKCEVDSTVELLGSMTLPSFEQETKYIALSQEQEYAFIGGVIESSDGESWELDDYRQVVKEFHVSHSTAKHAHVEQRPYMVGALARFNLNWSKLHPRAQSAATALNLAPICANPYMITLAQAVEVVHVWETAFALIQNLIEVGIAYEEPRPASRSSGTGIWACEAPRGTLYHDYVVRNGYLTEANCVIPTAQNLANIEADMRALVPTLLNQSKEQIELALEMLVRAYDPCISCSTHALEVKFVDSNRSVLPM